MKQRVLCCIDCNDPEVDEDKIQQRQEDTLLKLDVKSPGTIQGDDETDSHTELLTKIKKKSGFKLGRHLMHHLAKLVVMDPEKKGSLRLSHDSGDENDRHAMMFAPGRIMHLEVEKVDVLKK